MCALSEIKLNGKGEVLFYDLDGGGLALGVGVHGKGWHCY